LETPVLDTRFLRRRSQQRRKDNAPKHNRTDAAQNLNTPLPHLFFLLYSFCPQIDCGKAVFPQ
jgi:hypothetical protein